ncbi:MAG: hypothetical protein CME05_11450 [Gemmatimonadaceae bacterium]|nr:hypothetical protein [Gemmatimonadaceae bacterium]
MRTLAVCVILLALASFSASDPQISNDSRIDVLWVTGTVLLLALTMQRVCERLSLPTLWGWVGAGLIVGTTGLSVGNPSPDMQELLLCFVGLWAGLLVGIGFGWPSSSTHGHFLGIVTASTVVGALAVTLGCFLIADQVWTTALLVGALSALWGPVLVSSVWRDDESAGAALVGTLVAAVLLTWVIGWLHESKLLAGDGLAFATRVWISPALGIAIGWLLQLLSVLKRRSVALVALVLMSSLGAVVIDHYDLLGIGVGLGAGLALSFRPQSGRALDRLFGASRPLASFLFVALAISRVDVKVLLSAPSSGLFEIVLLQVIVLFSIRGLVPILWQPRISRSTSLNSWLLLPKGIVAIELLLVDGGLTDLLQPSNALLLQQIVFVDLLIYGLVATTLSAWMMRPAEEGSPP